MAGLLTLILRKNQARTRYGLWLAASVKFLIPFSLLVNLGSLLATPRASAAAQTALYFALEEASQPFTPSVAQVMPPAVHSTIFASLVPLLPAILVAAWLCGFVAVLFTWWVRWRRMSRVLREARPLREGREAEILRRLERAAGARRPMEVFLSQTPLEPGIFGIARPVLILPEGISQRLDGPHLEAILAHEVCHVRRRDNLAAAVHMVVEALFWFYPLVWWLSGRLVEERERACDEGVLALGSDRQIYARSLLRTCEFCVGSPLACRSGVTGADLKKRIVRIMSERAARKLDWRRKLLLGTAGLAAVAVPVVFGVANAPPSESWSEREVPVATSPRFQDVSVKPYESDAIGRSYGFSITDPPDDGTFYATAVTVEKLVEMAYGVHYSWLILRGPSWLNSEKFDIQAKSDNAVDNQLKALGPVQGSIVKRGLLQALLLDRFKLSAHRETKVLPAYALVIAKNGPKLRETKPGGADPHGSEGPDGLARAGEIGMDFNGITGQVKLTGHGIPISSPTSGPEGSLVQLLSGELGRTVLDQTGLKGGYHTNILARLLMELHILHRPVRDRTGLKGNYDFDLQWTSDQKQTATADGKPEPDSARHSESSAPGILTAIQQQLGLKLESTKAPVKVLVIDHVEQPSKD